MRERETNENPSKGSNKLKTETSTRSHVIAVVQALFVVFLWATSWVFVKVGLQHIPPITFAGLRYFLAFICLSAAMTFSSTKRDIRGLSKSSWTQLIILGILFYAITQGAIFIALAYLPAVTVNVLWSFSSVLIALLGASWLSEKPSTIQWAGMALALVGAMIYFYPVNIPRNQGIGVIVAILGILANSASSILGRDVNRSGKYHPLIVTVISMGTGSITLLIAGIATEGIPIINLRSWGIIIWLAVVNTAFAFTLWNHTLRTLSAVESSVINGSMMIWIPVLAIIFLHETITTKELIGLAITGLGTLIVQLRRSPQK
ncbi:MAG: EamA family transporter [Anaerolineales bacterium]|nr:EamA family transporter [Anaerolineales bacterium]